MMTQKSIGDTDREQDAISSGGNAASARVRNRVTVDEPTPAFSYDEIDPAKLLRVLDAVNRGDFHVRYPESASGDTGGIAGALNRLIGRNQALTAELQRIATAVAGDGRFGERVSIEDASGGWHAAVDSVNSLIEGLSPPQIEIERIIKKTEEIKRLNSKLEQNVLERTRALQAANADLQEEIAERTRAEEEVRRLNAELEERVRERTAELEAANRELEAFGYSVSHDLRGPLRRIHTFSALLLERILAKLDPEDQEYLRRISSSSLRMEQLIDDMLDLSSVTHNELQRRQVDLSGLAAQILDDLGSAEPDRHVSVRVQKGVVAVGDPGMLRMVLENLLENAWKFSSRRTDPTIEFKSTGGPAPVYLVRDNGVGFDASQAEVLFDPFRRLRGDYEGAGIGLSTVKRIITRHGGKIWAESAVDQGATFYFTLSA